MIFPNCFIKHPFPFYTMIAKMLNRCFSYGEVGLIPELLNSEGESIHSLSGRIDRIKDSVPCVHQGIIPIKEDGLGNLARVNVWNHIKSLSYNDKGTSLYICFPYL